jgi:polysaccharide export outer membrane protein
VIQLRPTAWTKAIFQRARRTDRLSALLLMGGLLLIVACTPVSRPMAAPKTANFHLNDDEINRMNAMILARTQSPGDPGEYLLGEGDLLRVSVFEAKELDTEVRVSSRGFITLPLIDAVNVKGLTAIEAEKTIEKRYQQRFIKNPHVSIFVEEHISQRITLVGQFRRPGTYDYPTKRRLLDVIALGGGLSENAGPMVQIRKSRHVRSEPAVIVVDLDRLINRGDVQLNIEINGGDVVFIPEAGVFFVDGAVRKPGTYTIKHHSTIREALVEAGGFETWAIKDRIKLARLEDNGERKLIDLDLKKPGVEDMTVKDRDILIVDESAAAGIMRGFSITFLGTGFTYFGR